MTQSEDPGLCPLLVLSCLQANQRGDAELFRILHMDRFRFASKRRHQWYIQENGEWVPDIMSAAANAVEDVAIEYDRLAEHISSWIKRQTDLGSITGAKRMSLWRKAAQKRAFYLRSGSGQSACLKMARKDPAFFLEL